MSDVFLSIGVRRESGSEILATGFGAFEEPGTVVFLQCGAVAVLKVLPGNTAGVDKSMKSPLNAKRGFR